MHSYIRKKLGSRTVDQGGQLVVPLTVVKFNIWHWTKMAIASEIWMSAQQKVRFARYRVCGI